VSLPPSVADANIFAWATIGHEGTGHDVLHADKGLLKELANAVGSEVRRAYPQNRFYSNYWSHVIDETASDCIAICHLGPAFAIGLICYFRGLLGGRLRPAVSASDVHPIDVLRGYYLSYIVKELMDYDKDEQDKWSKVIDDEVDKDLEGQVFGLVVDQRGNVQQLNLKEMKKTAFIAVRTILTRKMVSLENHSLIEIHNWGRDQQNQVISLLASRQGGPDVDLSTLRAAHIVSAACIESLSARGHGKLDDIFQWAKGLLVSLYKANPFWSPERGGISKVNRIIKIIRFVTKTRIVPAEDEEKEE